ncbi:MAG: hypothetical protein EOO32_00500 [Comamonadaceae bacterium]|nr:MAG: hypothetical protein EOO32_00500 [Comamonadaceae bacterium]
MNFSTPDHQNLLAQPWTPFAHTDDYPFTPHLVLTQWSMLHAGDSEPLPQNPAVLQAWTLFHSGHFQQAEEAGLAAGGAGITVANKAALIHATYLEPSEATRLARLAHVTERAEHQAQAEPNNANAWFWHAYAMARYSQGISVSTALAMGLGMRVRDTLHKVIALSPEHADARIALGAFHAEVIDKVGELVGRMTYGAQHALSLRRFQEALRLNPSSVIGKIEYASALLMLEGEKRMEEATRLYEAAAATEPLDALEHLGVELAQMELAE